MYKMATQLAPRNSHLELRRERFLAKPAFSRNGARLLPSTGLGAVRWLTVMPLSLLPRQRRIYSILSLEADCGSAATRFWAWKSLLLQLVFATSDCTDKASTCS